MLKVNYDGGFGRMRKYLQKLSSGGLRRTENQARWDLARMAAARVREEYRKFESSPSETELGAIRAGKERGALRPMRAGREPINVFAIFGDPGKGVIARKYPGGNRAYEVLANPTTFVGDASLHRPGGRSYPAGIPLGLLAHWIENPKPYVMRVSLRMLGYLYAVREGRAGPGTRGVGPRGNRAHLPDQPTRFSYVVHLPDRPVWRIVGAEMGELARRFYRTKLASYMRSVAAQFKGR